MSPKAGLIKYEDGRTSVAKGQKKEMVATGIDGKQYLGYAWADSNGTTRFAAYDWKGYRRSMTADHKYVETAVCGAADLGGNFVMDLAKIPSEAEKGSAKLDYWLFKDKRDLKKIEEAQKNIDAIEKTQAKWSDICRNAAWDSQETYDGLRILEKTGADLYATTSMVKGAGELWSSRNLRAPEVKTHVIDPVDAVTGSFYLPATDVALPDIDEEFKIERKYESLNNRKGIFGNGWTSNLESSINVKGDEIEVSCSDGHFEIFKVVNDQYVNKKGGSNVYTLSRSDNGWILKSNRERKHYEFNEHGKLTRIENRFGNTLKITYSNKNIDTISTFSNYKIWLNYQDGKVIEIKDELGRAVKYKYDGDYLTEVIHVDKGTTKYNYEEHGYISSVTDQNGYTYAKNFYDETGRVIRQENPNGVFANTIYDDIKKENIYYYVQSGRTEKIKYNDDNLITHFIYDDESFKEYGYDKYQNKVYEKDRNGNETFKFYDKYGNIIKEEKPNGLITEYVYDESHNLIKENDNFGREEINVYDNYSNLIQKKTKISKNEYKTEEFKYDSFGRIIEKNDGNNNISKYEYDIQNPAEGKIGKDPIRVITGSGYVYSYTYDEVGRNTSITTDYGTIEFGYNNLNYISEIKDANGNITLKFYDKMGNLIKIVTPNECIGSDADGKGYHYSYDFMDNLISIKNPLGIVSKNIRDSEGNIIKEINPNFSDSENQIGIEYVYDKNNNKIKAIYPDGGIERFFYDSNGNVIKHISPEYYDEVSDDGLGYSYTYDSMNHLKSIINEEGITEKIFEYDSYGNIIKETDSEGNSTLFKYDLVNNLLEKRVPVEKDDKSLEIKYQITLYSYDKNGNKICEKHGIDAVSKDEECYRFNEINFAYDNENRLIEVRDKYGAKTTYKYDCLNHKTYESFKINDTTNRVIHYSYDKVGNLIQKKEEIYERAFAPEIGKKKIFAVTDYKYDKNGNLIKTITPNGYEISRIYDEADRIIEQLERDPIHGILRSTVYEYDKADNVIGLKQYSGKDAEIIAEKYSEEYDYTLKAIDRYYKKKENDEKLKGISFDVNEKSYKYDEQNRLTHFISASGNTTRLFYDKNNRIIKQVLPEKYDSEKDDGVGTTYKYNVRGQVVEVKNALGHSITKNIYDVKGNLKTSIDGENNKIEYTYTLLGNIKDISTPNSRKENKKAQSYSYDARGNITGIVDGNGNETSYLLDDWGRIVQITTPEGGVEKYNYDYAGNMTSTTDANGGMIQYFYNSLGQVSEIKDQEGNSEYFYYDKEGNLTKHIDRNDNIVERIYNLDKNIVSAEAYNLNYDLLNKDEADENTKKAKIEDSSISENNILEINKNKNTCKKIDFRKKVLDTLEKKEKGISIENNTSEKITSDNISEKINQPKEEINNLDKYKLNLITQRFKYNPDGTLKNASFNNMYYNYTYNKEGLLESKSSCGKTLLKYTYDKNNNIKTIKDISGKSSIYNYDAAGRVSLITDEKSKKQAEYNYYNNDKIKSVILGNGIKSDYTYDGDGNVESLVTVTADGQILVDYNYAYDLNGNRLQKVSSKHKNFYSYDSMNRLVDSSYDGRQESFTYDKVGNRLTKTTNDITEKYIYNVKNQLKEIQSEDSKSVFIYDKQGNTLQEQTTSGNKTFEYNTLNQQVKAIAKEGNTLANRYDTEGLRYEIEENEKLARFIFNKNGDILVETDSDDNVVSRFTRGHKVVSADISGERSYYSVDEQGSTEFISDSFGNIRNEYWYDAFGNVLDSKEDVHNRITYTGQQFDKITQQYYLRARFYNPVIGRFTQEDVYRGDGLNLYAYCGNNPVGYCDPSGYSVCPYGNKENNFAQEEFERFYRTMSDKEFKKLVENRKLTRREKGASELKVTMDEDYVTKDLSNRKNQSSRKYNSSVKLEVESGTQKQLLEIGEAQNPIPESPFDELPLHEPGINTGKLEIKGERGDVISYGLGSSEEALNIFNSNMKNIYKYVDGKWELIE